MAGARRVTRSSPATRRMTGAGLVALLAAAAAAGTLVGWLPHRRGEEPRSAPSVAVTAEDHTRRSARPPDLQPRRVQPAEPAPAAKASDYSAPKPTVKKEIASSRSNSEKRPAAYAGETAFVRDAGSKIALTFDAGASAAPTPALLDTLAAAGVRATFFLTGRWCEKNPELVKRIAAEGHEIANHTYFHRDLRKLTDDQIKDELSDMNDLVVRLTGHDTAPFFRPPYGARDRRVLRVAAELGYASIYWSVDSWDAFKKGITADEVRDRVLEKARAGDIVLMHCGSRPTIEALPEIIQELKDRGLRIVTVSELLQPAS